MKRNEWIYATAAQEAYLRRLISETRNCVVRWNVDLRRQMLKSAASRAIDMLKLAKTGAFAVVRREAGEQAHAEMLAKFGDESTITAADAEARLAFMRKRAPEIEAEMLRTKYPLTEGGAK